MKKTYAVFMLALAASAASAQSGNGGILGEVTDTQKGLVQNADVVIKSVDTGAETHLKTNARGVFTAPSLQPGSYTVTVSKEGFATGTEAISVDIAATANANVTLVPGRQQDVITVTAVNQVDLDTPSISSNVDSKVVEDAPLAERSALSLVLLLPGVQVDGFGVGSENPNAFTGAVAPGATLAIGGGRIGSVSQLVDGSDITLNGVPRTGITFSAHSIKQIAVQTGSLPAQYGRNGGGIVNQVSLNGTSKYHGYVGYRHYDPFFTATGYGQLNQDIHQTLYTATLSGPVPIRGLRKNTFFFASFEPFRGGSLGPNRARLFTPDELNGFEHDSLDVINTSVLKSSGYAAALAAPRPGSAGGTGANATNTYGLAYHNDNNDPKYGIFPYSVPYPSTASYRPIIGTGSSPTITDNPNKYDDVSAQVNLNPLSKYLRAVLPSPSNPGPYARFDNPQGTYDALGENGIVDRGVINTDTRYSIRVDHSFKNSDTLYARYSYVPVDGQRFNYVGLDSPINFVPEEKVVSDNAVFGYTHLFRSNAVNEFRAVYLFVDDNITPPRAGLTADFGPMLGLLPAINGRGFPAIGGLPANTQAIGQGGTAGVVDNQIFGTGDDFSLLLGKHNFKLGGEFRALQLNEIPAFGFGGNYTFASSATAAVAGGGSFLATTALGLITSASFPASAQFYYRWHYYAAYAQDTWRVLPRVTINYGMRYNLETPRTEENNNQGNFNTSLQGTLNGLPVTGGFVFSGQNGQSRNLWPINYKGFEPRVSIAAQPTNRTVIRAAYSLVHSPLTGLSNALTPNLAPSAANLGGVTGAGVAGFSVDFIANPLTSVGNLSTIGGGNKAAPLFNYIGAGIIPQTPAVPYIQLYNASVQLALGRNGSIEIDYAGQRGIHLFSTAQNRNAPALDAVQRVIASHASFGTATPNPYTGINETYLQSLSPYPALSNAQLLTEFARQGASNYNAVYISGRGTLPLNFTVQGYIQWSKSLDNTSSGISSSVVDSYGYAAPQSTYDFSNEYSLSTFDVPVSAAAGYSWTLPVGRGQRLMGNSNRLVDALVGGWRTSGIFRAASAGPIWVQLGGVGYFFSTGVGSTKAGNQGNGLPSGITLRPNLVAGVPLINPAWRHSATKLTTPYLNGAAFSVPGSLDNPEFGTAPRTLGGARSPNVVYFDAALRKSFALSDHGRVRLELSLDAINALNHPNWIFNPNQGHVLNPVLCTSATPSPGCSGLGSYTAAPAGTANPGDISTGTFGVFPAATSPRLLAIGGSISF